MIKSIVYARKRILDLGGNHEIPIRVNPPGSRGTPETCQVDEVQVAHGRRKDVSQAKPAAEESSDEKSGKG